MYTEVKQPTRFIHVASRETAGVYTYVGARFFQFFLALDFIRNILANSVLGHVKREHLHFLA